MLQSLNKDELIVVEQNREVVLTSDEEKKCQIKIDYSYGIMVKMGDSLRKLKKHSYIVNAVLLFVSMIYGECLIVFR